MLFCLGYARQGGWGAASVWQDVQQVFSNPEMVVLYPDPEQVNSFRSTRVAHVEMKLDNPDEAWEAMRVWLRCLAGMHHATAKNRREKAGRREGETAESRGVHDEQHRMSRETTGRKRPSLSPACCLPKTRAWRRCWGGTMET
jgi:hypothetical protein